MCSSLDDFCWTLSLPYCGAYLSIDDILASSERTPCRVRTRLPCLAPLLCESGLPASNIAHDGENFNEHDIPTGSKLELPIWLVQAVGGSRHQLLTLDLPPIYREAFAEVFAADPSVVDLRRKAPYYYLTLCNLVKIGHNRMEQVTNTATKVFQFRLKCVMDAAMNAGRQDILASTAKFDQLEMSLFHIGQHERLRLERWTARCHSRIEPSAAVKSMGIHAAVKRKKALHQREDSSVLE